MPDLNTSVIKLNLGDLSGGISRGQKAGGKGPKKEEFELSTISTESLYSRAVCVGAEALLR